MSKKTFTKIIVLLVVVALAVFVWFFFFRKSPDGTAPGNDFLRNLFPFGDRGITIPEPETPDINLGKPTTPTPGGIARLRKLHDRPVSGAVVFNDSVETKIRFVERATGHIFETYAFRLDKLRLSNTTIPKIYEALWSNTGTELLMRYLKDDNDTVRTFYTKISTTTTDQTIGGVFLEDNLRQVSVFGNRVFYFRESAGEFMGLVSDMDGSKKIAIFTTSFGKFIPKWTSPNKILLSSGPESGLFGSIYLLDVLTGNYKKIVSEVPGGIGLASVDGNVAFVSSGEKNVVEGYVVGIATSLSDKRSVDTLADKCVFSSTEPNLVYCSVPKLIPSGDYPESWYQGLVSFNDRLWQIDTTTGETELVFDPVTEGAGEMDIINLSMNQDDSSLIFTNKKDLSLWIYLLKI